jgi:AcrR family transcriptional regulator
MGRIPGSLTFETLGLILTKRSINMSPRDYRMDQRAAGTAATRDRILHATMELHASQGVLATSHRDVAARADVSVGSVYHHFPTSEQLVAACGAKTFAMFPPPPANVIDPSAPLARRIEQLAEALVPYYEQLSGFTLVRADRGKMPVLDQGIKHFENAIEALIRRALGNRPRGRNAVVVVAALLDFSVVERLTAAGMPAPKIAATLAAIIIAWMKGKTT